MSKLNGVIHVLLKYLPWPVGLILRLVILCGWRVGEDVLAEDRVIVPRYGEELDCFSY